MRKAVILNPNSAFSAGFVWSLSQAGRASETIEYHNKSLRLNPSPPPWLYFAAGDAYLKQEARDQVPQLLRINRNFSISTAFPDVWEKISGRKDMPDPDLGQCSIDEGRRVWMLYKAGAPE